MRFFFRKFRTIALRRLLPVASYCGVTRRKGFDELLRISFDCGVPSRVFCFFSPAGGGLEEESTTPPVLSHVFKGITRHRETLRVIKCVLSAGRAGRGEACQQGFAAHVCSAPTAVPISPRREGVKREAFCRLLEVFIKKC